MAARPWMVIRGVGPANWSYQFRPGSQTIGRSSDCELYINHKSLSRVHAEIRLHGAALSIRDLGSTNGTFVNEVRITESSLQIGDTVRLGRVVLDVLERPEITHGKDAYVLERTDRDEAESDTKRLSADGLSDAEGQVLDLLLQGRSEKEVAQRRGVTRETIDKQVQSIYRFFGVETRAELLALHISRRNISGTVQPD